MISTGAFVLRLNNLKRSDTDRVHVMFLTHEKHRSVHAVLSRGFHSEAVSVTPPRSSWPLIHLRTSSLWARKLTRVSNLFPQIAGVGAAFGEKGEKGEPAVIEPVSRPETQNVEVLAGNIRQHGIKTPHMTVVVLERDRRRSDWVFVKCWM